LKSLHILVRTMADCAQLQYLFVYGTLRKGLQNPMSEFLSRHADLVGTGSFRGRLYDSGRYPCAVLSDDEGDSVVGDLFSLRDGCEALLALDEYEACDMDNPDRGLYIRTMAEVDIQGGGRVCAWVYIYNRSVRGMKTISSGDYLQSLGRQYI
jgi:gamma-glutamylcyclotransferase (GGCT)/AIG2-like uncharacterized protein YtfP